jgi:hypothetical protein
VRLLRWQIEKFKQRNTRAKKNKSYNIEDYNMDTLAKFEVTLANFEVAAKKFKNISHGVLHTNEE